MEHQVLAEQPAGIGQAVGESAGGGVQQQPRCADAVAGDDDDLGRLELLDAVDVVIDHAGRHAVFAGGDLAHAAIGAQFDTGADGVRPVGDVGARLRPLGAGRRAMAEIDAGRAAVVFGGGDRGVGRPPMPAELVHRLRRSWRRTCPAAAAASAARAPDRRDRRQGPRRPSCGRSRQRTAPASRNRSASHRPRRPACGRGSRMGAGADNAPCTSRSSRRRR